MSTTLDTHELSNPRHSRTGKATDDTIEDVDEEERLAREVANYIDEALGGPPTAPGKATSTGPAPTTAIAVTPTFIHASSATSTATSSPLALHSQANSEYDIDDEDDELEIYDLFGDEVLLSNGDYHDGGSDSNTRSLICHVDPSPDASSSAPPSCSPPARSPSLGLTLPLGNGKPIIRSTDLSSTGRRSSATSTPTSRKPQNPRPPPPSHLPKRLSGADFKRIRERREIEYREAQEKLSRGEITPEQMPSPVQQRMTRRKKARLQEEEEMRRPFLLPRNQTLGAQISSLSAASRAVITSPGSSATTPAVNSQMISDEDDEVRELVRSAWQGAKAPKTRDNDISTIRTAPSASVDVTAISSHSLPSAMAIGSDSHDSPHLPLPKFASSKASFLRSASLITTASPKTLLNMVLKPGLERRWSTEILPSSPGTVQGSPSLCKAAYRNGGRVVASASPPIPRMPSANPAPFAKPISPSLADNLLSVSVKASSSVYTGPLRHQLKLAREDLALQVKSHQNELNRPKLEADVLSNANRVVDARILFLETSRAERRLARENQEEEGGGGGAAV